MSEEEEFTDEEFNTAAGITALINEMDSLEVLEAQQLKEMNEGNITIQIVNMQDSLNRVNELLIISGLADKPIINSDNLKCFNKYVNDYFSLLDLLKEVFGVQYGSIAPTRGQEFCDIFVPVYEREMNAFCSGETGKSWAELEYSDFYLRRYLFARIKELGYTLQAQMKVAMSLKLPRDTLEQIMFILRKASLKSTSVEPET